MLFTFWIAACAGGMAIPIPARMIMRLVVQYAAAAESCSDLLLAKVLDDRSVRRLETASTQAVQCLCLKTLPENCTNINAEPLPWNSTSINHFSLPVTAQVRSCP